jgi:hypothetical protein
MISSRRFVTKLILGHNELSDDGCIVLFKFLASSVGRKYQIAEISLNANSIGNRGLLAISEYLQGNKVLKELFLQNVVQCIFLNAMVLTLLCLEPVYRGRGDVCVIHDSLKHVLSRVLVSHN